MISHMINYLGYPGSLGSDIIDYIIADKIVIPDGDEKFYTEKVIRMPNCYLCTDYKMEISKDHFSRKEFKLPKIKSGLPFSRDCQKD